MRLILNSSFYFRVSLCETRLFYYLRCNRLLNADPPVILEICGFLRWRFFGMLKIRAESLAQTFGIVVRNFQFLFLIRAP